MNNIKDRMNNGISNFSKDELIVSTNPMDVIDMSIKFIKKHWDDIIIVVFILSIIVTFILITGIEYSPDSDIENNIRKIIFRSSPNDYKRKKQNEKADKDYDKEDKDKIFIVEDEEPPDTERYQFKG